MDTNRILADLRAERERLDQAIAALEALTPGGTIVRRGRPAKAAAVKATRGGRRQISAAGRARIAEAAKKMWERRKRKAGAGKKSASTKAAPVRKMSEAARKRISEAAKKRWAAQKKAAVSA